MPNQNFPFYPTDVTVNIPSVTTSGNDRVQLPAGAAAFKAAYQLRFYNSAAVDIFVKWGKDNSVTSSTADGLPIAKGDTKVYTVQAGTAYVAAVVASGSAGPFYATPGEGGIV